MQRSAKIALGAVVVFLAPISVSITLFMLHQARNMDMLKKDGVRTSAVIDRLYTTTDKRNVVYYNADYIFNPPASGPDGVHGRTNLSHSDFMILRVGSRIDVMFVPYRPKISVPAGFFKEVTSRAWPEFYHWAWTVNGIFGSIIAICVVYVMDVFLRERHLLRYGAACPAWIIKEMEVRVKYGTRTHVTYEFEFNGKIFHGERRDLPGRQELSNYQAWMDFDSAIRKNPIAQFDPDRPSRNMLYPPTMARVVQVGS